MLVKCLSKGKNTIAWLELNILQGSFWESPSHRAPNIHQDAKQTIFSIGNPTFIQTYQINTMKSGDPVLKSKLHIHKIKKIVHTTHIFHEYNHCATLSVFHGTIQFQNVWMSSRQPSPNFNFITFKLADGNLHVKKYHIRIYHHILKVDH